MQLDMFKDINIQELDEKIENVKKLTVSVQKGIFARHTAHDKRLIELWDKLEAQDEELYKIKKWFFDNGLSYNQRKEVGV